MKKIFYILLFTQTVIIYSQSGWVQQSPLPTSSALLSIKFVNNSTGFICGYQTILKTTNNGTLWNIIDSNSSFYFNSLNFFDSNTLLVLGSHSPYTSNFKILKTTNGGENWTQIDLPTSKLLFKISCTTNNTAYIVGDSGVILKSINRGDNWTLLPQINTVKYFSSVFFVNEYTGYTTASLVGGTSVYKTTDGGYSWIQQTVNQTTGILSTVFFLDENTGYVAGGYSIFKTTDGGNNWNLQNSPVTDNIVSISFANPNTGYAVGDYGTILRTTDGQNWSFQITYLYHEESLGEVFALSPDTAYLVGGLGQIAVTNDGGNNWNSQFSGTTTDINSICFPSLNTGYAVGLGIGDPNRTLIKTTNGGINWLYKSIPSLGPGQKVYFLNDTVGFILSDVYILKTTDGGNNWINYSPQNISYNDINFVNNLTGYVTGDSIFKTSNGGINWFSISEGGGLAIKFIDINTGYIAGYNGEIIKTTNGGINWFSQNSGTSEDLLSLYFNNENTGYVCGYGLILKTVNGGINWIPIFTDNNFDLRSIYFTSINNGYAVGSDENLLNVIIKTINGGLNWNTNTCSSDYLYSIFFTNDSVGYCAGSAGLIFKTTNGGEPIGTKQISNKIPQNFILYQNYPNPFNPSTKIKFIIPEESFTTLKIYNVLGQEVAVIVNQNLKAGIYEYEWNGNNYSSGIYFYQLKSKNFIESKKLVLIK